MMTARVSATASGRRSVCAFVLLSLWLTIFLAVGEPAHAISSPSPVAYPSALAVQQDTPASGKMMGWSPNGALVFTLAGTPAAKGTVNIIASSTGDFTYTPNAGTTGADAVSFVVTDPTTGIQSYPATITIDIAPAPPFPVNKPRQPSVTRMQASSPGPNGLSLTVNAPGPVFTDSQAPNATATLQINQTTGNYQVTVYDESYDPDPYYGYPVVGTCTLNADNNWTVSDFPLSLPYETGYLFVAEAQEETPPGSGDYTQFDTASANAYVAGVYISDWDTWPPTVATMNNSPQTLILGVGEGFCGDININLTADPSIMLPPYVTMPANTTLTLDNSNPTALSLTEQYGMPIANYPYTLDPSNWLTLYPQAPGVAKLKMSYTINNQAFTAELDVIVVEVDLSMPSPILALGKWQPVYATVQPASLTQGQVSFGFPDTVTPCDATGAAIAAPAIDITAHGLPTPTSPICYIKATATSQQANPQCDGVTACYMDDQQDQNSSMSSWLPITCVDLEKLQYAIGDGDFADVVGDVSVPAGVPISFKAVPAPEDYDWSVLGTPTWSGDTETPQDTDTQGASIATATYLQNDVVTATFPANGTTLSANVVISPIITAPDDITVEQNGPDGTWLSADDLGTPLWADAFDWEPTITTGLPDDPHLFSHGKHSVTWTLTDIYGYTCSATQTVTVVDTTPPFISAIPLVVEATSAAGALVQLSEQVFDLCDLYPWVTPAAQQCPLGLTTVTVTATDCYGLTSSQDISVTVQDTTPPVITLQPTQSPSYPINPTIRQTCAFGAYCALSATAYDLVDGAVTPTNDAPTIFSSNPPTTTVTWTATDKAGNSSSTTETVTVINDDIPTAYPQTVYLQNGASSVTIYLTGFDPDGRTLTYNPPPTNTPLTYGAITYTSPNQIVYTLYNTNVTGTDAFDFTVTASDGTTSATSAPATITMKIINTINVTIPALILVSDGGSTAVTIAVSASTTPVTFRCTPTYIDDADPDGDADAAWDGNTTLTITGKKAGIVALDAILPDGTVLASGQIYVVAVNFDCSAVNLAIGASMTATAYVTPDAAWPYVNADFGDQIIATVTEININLIITGISAGTTGINITVPGFTPPIGTLPINVGQLGVSADGRYVLADGHDYATVTINSSDPLATINISASNGATPSLTSITGSGSVTLTSTTPGDATVTASYTDASGTHAGSVTVTFFLPSVSVNAVPVPGQANWFAAAIANAGTVDASVSATPGVDLTGRVTWSPANPGADPTVFSVDQTTAGETALTCTVQGNVSSMNTAVTIAVLSVSSIGNAAGLTEIDTANGVNLVAGVGSGTVTAQASVTPTDPALQPVYGSLLHWVGGAPESAHPDRADFTTAGPAQTTTQVTCGASFASATVWVVQVSLTANGASSVSLRVGDAPTPLLLSVLPATAPGALALCNSQPAHVGLFADQPLTTSLASSWSLPDMQDFPLTGWLHGISATTNDQLTATYTWGGFTLTTTCAVAVTGSGTPPPPPPSGARLRFYHLNPNGTLGADLTNKTLAGNVRVFLELTLGQGEHLAANTPIFHLHVQDTDPNYSYPAGFSAYFDGSAINVASTATNWYLETTPGNPATADKAGCCPALANTSGGPVTYCVSQDIDTRVAPWVTYQQDATYTPIKMGHNGRHTCSLLDSANQPVAPAFRRADNSTYNNGPVTVDKYVTNLVVSNLAVTTGTQDYLKYDPDPTSPYHRPVVSFAIANANPDVASYTCWAMIQPTANSGTEFVSQIRLLKQLTFTAYVYNPNAAPTQITMPAWDGSIVTGIDPVTNTYTESVADCADWGTYTYDVYVKACDNAGNTVDCFDMKWPYSLSISNDPVSGHNVWINSTAQCDQLLCFYKLDDLDATLPNFQQPSNITMQAIDGDLNTIGSPVAGPGSQVDQPYGDANNGLLVYSAPYLHGLWRVVFTGQDNSWAIYRRDHSPTRMLAVNCVEVFIELGYAVYTLTTAGADLVNGMSVVTNYAHNIEEVMNLDPDQVQQQLKLDRVDRLQNHIIKFHGDNSTYGLKSKFLTHDENKIQELIFDALQKGKLRNMTGKKPLEPGRINIKYQFGHKIGTDIKGNDAFTLVVSIIVDGPLAGQIWNAFPVPDNY